GGGDPRESATESKPPRLYFGSSDHPVGWSRNIGGGRVKGGGKGPPRSWQQERHGKPHREQDRIGTARGEHPQGGFRPGRSGRLHEAGGNAGPRGMAATSGASAFGHTEPGLQAG